MEMQRTAIHINESSRVDGADEPHSPKIISDESLTNDVFIVINDNIGSVFSANWIEFKSEDISLLDCLQVWVAR